MSYLQLGYHPQVLCILNGSTRKVNGSYAAQQKHRLLHIFLNHSLEHTAQPEIYCRVQKKVCYEKLYFSREGLRSQNSSQLAFNYYYSRKPIQSNGKPERMVQRQGKWSREYHPLPNCILMTHKGHEEQYPDTNKIWVLEEAWIIANHLLGTWSYIVSLIHAKHGWL